jgi:hypothetical protein
MDIIDFNRQPISSLSHKLRDTKTRFDLSSSTVASNRQESEHLGTLD